MSTVKSTLQRYINFSPGGQVSLVQEYYNPARYITTETLRVAHKDLFTPIKFESSLYGSEIFECLSKLEDIDEFMSFLNPYWKNPKKPVGECRETKMNIVKRYIVRITKNVDHKTIFSSIPIDPWVQNEKKMFYQLDSSYVKVYNLDRSESTYKQPFDKITLYDLLLLLFGINFDDYVTYKFENGNFHDWYTSSVVLSPFVTLFSNCEFHPETTLKDIIDFVYYNYDIAAFVSKWLQVSHENIERIFDACSNPVKSKFTELAFNKTFSNVSHGVRTHCAAISPSLNVAGSYSRILPSHSHVSCLSNLKLKMNSSLKVGAYIHQVNYTLMDILICLFEQLNLSITNAKTE